MADLAITKTQWVSLGVLLWGLPTAVVFSLMRAFNKPGTWGEMVKFQSDVCLQTVVVALPLCMFIGICVGLYFNHLYVKNSELK
jgi:hypothetical protein